MMADSNEVRNMEQQDLWDHNEIFSWLPDEGLETLGACFNQTVEPLKAGETRHSAGRVAYLLSGKARTDTDKGEVAAGTLLGIKVTERGEKKSIAVTLEAIEDCDVIWFDFELLRMVCYAACWFHVRFLKEIDRLLEQK